MTWQTVIDALPVAVPALVIALFQLRRSRQVDAVAEKSGVAANGRAGTAQIIEGLKTLVEALQSDNDDFREDIKALVIRLDVITVERDALKLEVARLRKKYGDNGES